MNKYVSIIVVLVVIGLGIWFFARAKQPGTSGDAYSTNPVPLSPTGGVKPLPEGDNGAAINNLDNKNMKATINTSEGKIEVEFYAADAPKTVENFTKLAGAGFYNGIKFHRVIKGFMIQGGDPNSKDDSKMDMWGTGGPGYKFADEIDANSSLYKTGYKKGILAMANSGPNTNGSQFFIMTEDYPLPPLYTIFGHVTSGQDVVDKIANVKTGANDRPATAVIINSITLQ